MRTSIKFAVAYCVVGYEPSVAATASILDVSTAPSPMAGAASRTRRIFAVHELWQAEKIERRRAVDVMDARFKAQEAAQSRADGERILTPPKSLIGDVSLELVPAPTSYEATVSHARTHVLNTLEEPTEQGVWAWLPGILNAASAKPKWMRWLTFERLTEQHAALVARSAAAPLASGA